MRINKNPYAVLLNQSEKELIDSIFKMVEGIPLDRLKEICNAERDGRVFVLPETGKESESCSRGGKAQCPKHIFVHITNMTINDPYVVKAGIWIFIPPSKNLNT